MKTLILLGLMSIITVSWSQSRPGGGPGPTRVPIDSATGDKVAFEPIAVSRFMYEVNQNLKKCSEQKNVGFTNIVHLYNYYSLKEALRKELIECTAAPLPQEFRCAFGGGAKVRLQELMKDESLLHSHLITDFRIKEKEAEDVKKFFRDLNAKLSKEEQE